MPELWEVVGGTDAGGIIVRKGVEVKSTAEPERLANGALVEELDLRGERLRYRKLRGAGPESGWVTIRLKTKDLVVRTTRDSAAVQAKPSERRAPAAVGAAPATAPSSSSSASPSVGTSSAAPAASASAVPTSGSGGGNGGSGGVSPGGHGGSADANAEDIFAALDTLGKSSDESAKASPETVYATHAPLLHRLFDTPDSDQGALREALAEVASAAAEEGLVNFILWRRALPLIMDAPERAKRVNLFGLLVDYQCGLFANSLSGSSMNEVACEAPAKSEGSPSGLVVFLLGWGGGRCQDLDDIGALYRHLYPGAVIVRLTCNTKASFGLRCECAFAIRAASQAWAHCSKDAHPKLLVHLFSNAGFMTWTEMLQSWDAICNSQRQHPALAGSLPRLSEVLRGVVLDSSPNAQVPIDACIQSQLQGMAAFIFQVAASDHDGSEDGKRIAERNGKKAMLILIGDQSPVKAHLAKKPEEVIQKVCSAESAIVHELEPPVELQFIYSRDDNIICFHGIEEYVDEVIARPSRQGVPTPQSLVFDKSKHVAHKSNHRDAYLKCVERFSSAVLKAKQ